MSLSLDFTPDNLPQAAIVNPKYILDIGAVRPYEGRPVIITDPKDGECALQQNGIDLRLDEVQIADGFTSFHLNKVGDNKCSYWSVMPLCDEMFHLEVGKQYAFDFMEEIEVPTGMAAYLFIRSSMNRYSGIFTVGLYDSGFRGRLGGIFRPFIDTYIQKGCRAAQVVFFTSDSNGAYAGQYQDQKKQV
jgi:deoxycytidine triphosphate deaminase